VPADEIELLTHGPEADALKRVKDQRRKRKPGKQVQILSASNLVPLKGLHVVMEALARVRDLDCRLWLYGQPGADAHYMERLAALARADKRIELAGTFPPDEITGKLAQASVMILPVLWYENGPLVIKEALLAGVPVVASDIGSVSEMIDGVEGCRLLPPGDVAAWAAWLEDLKSKPLPHVIDAPDQPDMARFYASLLGRYRELAGT
jgi:glycosyltransferase involved in cell wall biosynthesis